MQGKAATLGERVCSKRRKPALASQERRLESKRRRGKIQPQFYNRFPIRYNINELYVWSFRT